MWSAIGLATHQQLRLAGARLAAPLARQTATAAAAPVARFRRINIHGAVVVRRAFSVTRARPTPAAAAKKTPPKKKPAAKKPTPKKKKVAKKKAAPKKKPAPTDDQKLALKIRELKQIGLLKGQPDLLPTGAWRVFASHRLAGQKRSSQQGDDMRAVAEEYRTLSAAERAKLELESDQNKAANLETYRSWVEAKSPQEIRIANTARRVLKRADTLRIADKKLAPIKDHRVPSRPLTAYNLYARSRYESGDLAGMSLRDATLKVAAEFKALSDSERKPFEDAYKATQLEHQEQMRRVLGPDYNKGSVMRVSLYLRPAKKTATA